MKGVKFFVLKGYRGDHQKGYGLMIICESKEVYDKYWDKKGEPTDHMQEIIDKELKSIAEEGKKLGSMKWDFTDWVVL